MAQRYSAFSRCYIGFLYVEQRYSVSQRCDQKTKLWNDRVTGATGFTGHKRVVVVVLEMKTKETKGGDENKR